MLHPLIVGLTGLAVAFLAAPTFVQDPVSVVQEWTGGQGEPFFGAAVARGGDLDGDGFDDVLVGDKFSTDFTGRVHAYSGRTGSLLFEVSGSVLGEQFGFSVDGPGDVGAGKLSSVVR